MSCHCLKNISNTEKIHRFNLNFFLIKAGNLNLNNKNLWKLLIELIMLLR